MKSKADIRRQNQLQRDQLAAAEIASASLAIETRLLDIDAVRDAQTWSVYVSGSSEVQTHRLIQALLDRGLTIALPRVVGPGEMVMQRVASLTELKLAASGFLEPIADANAVLESFDVCVCPGIAFTERGDRLGSGAGFYDRYLAAHQPRVCIGLAFDFQIEPELPIEAHDRRMDFVITQTRTFQAARASR